MGLAGPGAARLKATRLAANDNAPAAPWLAAGLTRAGRVCAFLEALPVTAGPLAGTRLVLRPWQRKIVEAIYATGAGKPVSRDSGKVPAATGKAIGNKLPIGKRLVRTALITLPRKNGKTQLAAGLALAHLLGPESEPRGQCFSAASDRKQAALVFNELEAIILAMPEFAARVNVQRFHKRIEVLAGAGNGSTYEALSADARKAHGLNVSFAIYDELAQAPNRHLYDNLVTGTGGRAEPLVVVISTQSADPLHIMSELVDYGAQVNDGIIDDPTFHATIFAAPDDADPWAEATWFACNPALGDFRSLDEMRAAAAMAKRLPARESAFRNLYLNQRVESEERFINATEWEACAGPVDLAALAGRECFGGLDLGSVRDLTSLVLVFPDDAGGFDVVPFFWCPRDSLGARSDTDKVPYDVWARLGLIEPTPGAATDHSFVVHRLGELAQTFDIKSVAYDRWRIEDLKRQLADEDIDVPLVEWGQGFKDMAPAVDWLETLIIGRKLRHGGNPILRWNAANAVVTRDAAGGRKLDKDRSREKIDGLVALTMGLGLARRFVAESVPACLEWAA
jgi:phage terminase large subunit-like protein